MKYYLLVPCLTKLYSSTVWTFYDFYEKERKKILKKFIEDNSQLKNWTVGNIKFIALWKISISHWKINSNFEKLFVLQSTGKRNCICTVISKESWMELFNYSCQFKSVKNVLDTLSPCHFRQKSMAIQERKLQRKENIKTNWKIRFVAFPWCFPLFFISCTMTSTEEEKKFCTSENNSKTF